MVVCGVPLPIARVLVVAHAALHSSSRRLEKFSVNVGPSLAEGLLGVSQSLLGDTR